MPDAAAIEDTILRMLATRGPAASMCPSEAARALAAPGTGWRALMPAVRDAARVLAGRGLVEVSQRGAACDPSATWRGPVRLRRGPGFRLPEAVDHGIESRVGPASDQASEAAAGQAAPPPADQATLARLV